MAEGFAVNTRRVFDEVCSATDKLFVEITRQVEQDFLATTRPVMQVVSLLSHTRIITGENLEERLAAVSLLADILKKQPTISAPRWAMPTVIILSCIRSASGVYLEYGKKYLSPDQLDEVDINDYLN